MVWSIFRSVFVDGSTKPAWSYQVSGDLLWPSIEFDSISTGVALSPPLTDAILRKIRKENIAITKLHYIESKGTTKSALFKSMR